MSHFPSHQLHLCKGNSEENHQLLPIIVEFETHFIQSSSESVMPENTESILKFVFSNTLPIIFLYHRGNYLFNQTTWSICKEPENIILWNIILFSILLAIGAIEAILCFIQVVNGLAGFICGTCMRKRKVGMQEKISECFMFLPLFFFRLDNGT